VGGRESELRKRVRENTHFVSEIRVSAIIQKEFDDFD
jgi:hypothetical protein